MKDAAMKDACELDKKGLFSNWTSLLSQVEKKGQGSCLPMAKEPKEQWKFPELWFLKCSQN